MACKATWNVVPGTLDDIADDERLFFDEHQWLTIEAATARIIPTDHDPGAREAAVVRFIDCYLSGIKYIYASADGSGFLELDGALAEAWRQHIAELQALYVDGIRRLDRLASDLFDTSFSELSDDQQDQVLVELSGTPKPEPMASLESRGSGYGFALQSDVSLDFFSTLCLHTRQGFYCDPVYGGNRDRVGWTVIGFPGPERLVDTQTCSYSLEHLLVSEYDWSELVPHLKTD
jgi:gluconate 2-dehydrogenase gamma chain